MIFTITIAKTQPIPTTNEIRAISFCVSVGCFSNKTIFQNISNVIMAIVANIVIIEFYLARELDIPC